VPRARAVGGKPAGAGRRPTATPCKAAQAETAGCGIFASAAAAGAPPGSQRAGADSDARVYGRVQHYGGPRAGLHLASAARSAQSGALASRPVVWRWAERSKISTLAQEHKQYKSPAVTNLFSGTNAELVQTPALLQSVTVSRLEATRTKT
jgi:hypothetical protein